MYKGLRGYIEEIEKRDELKRVNGADADLEIGALTAMVARRGKSHPALLFDQIKGYSNGFRILTNFMTTAPRSKLAFGLDPDAKIEDPLEYVLEVLEEFTPVPPKHVSDGPVMENVQRNSAVDLFKFPAPKWHLLDGGKYLGTADVVMMRNPDEQTVNAGSYRLQLHDRQTLSIAVNPGHHGWIIERKYWEKGLACPVLVSLGHDPRLAVATNMYLPWGVDELDYAGWLRKEPLEIIPGPVTGLPIPADSEIVIEGEIPPLTEASIAEGPFGEFGGYYSVEGRPQPIIRVKAVYYRNDPIALGAPPFRGINHNGVLPIPDAILLRELHRAGFSDIKKLGRIGPFLVVSLKTRYAGHARRVADFIMSGIGMRPPKYVLMVDDDIDVHSVEDVLWVLQTRVDAEESIYLVKNRWGSPTDPRIPPEKKKIGDISAPSLIIDGTRPWAWKDEYPKTTDFPAEMNAQLSKKWAELLGP